MDPLGRAHRALPRRRPARTRRRPPAPLAARRAAFKRRPPGILMIDLRSDTVTKPTPAMRRAMAEAEVGDDVYQEDPTVNRLEARAAELMGKEAGLFVPTGTMGNTIGMTVHTQHGQEVICDSRSHVLNYELSMLAWFAGCLARAIPTAKGHLTWDAIAKEIRPVGPHAAPTGLIAVENTHNVAGGTVYPLEQLAEIKRGAESRGLPVHMDGARFFHAATALNVAPTEIAQYADTVMFCLSKGLGAPAGSMLVGTQQQMDKGRLLRSPRRDARPLGRRPCQRGLSRRGAGATARHRGRALRRHQHRLLRRLRHRHDRRGGGRPATREGRRDDRHGAPPAPRRHPFRRRPGRVRRGRRHPREAITQLIHRLQCGAASVEV
ncbi:MAG: hypothetical protein B7X34_08245 [Acidobacteriia bacterium 12-62-4]|nr:MAG: hypothetical protein B7X34_08245 [Acidobacteriia bacterium 12-62-4]